MKKVLLRSVLTLLASVSILVAAMQGADAKAAQRLSPDGRIAHWQGDRFLAKARGGCGCPGPRPLQRQAIPPEIWLDSYSIKPGQTIGFGGRGFQPGERVDIRLGDLEDVPSRSQSRLLVATFANAGGNVKGEASIPFLPPGDYPFIAAGHQSQGMLIRNLTVLGFAPWVVLDDYAPPPSTQFGFKGQGFAPGEPVLVYFDQQTSQLVTQLKADGDGEFAVYRGVESPNQPGDHALILVGVYSGSVVKVNFETLPAAPAPSPSPGTQRWAGLAEMPSRLSAGGLARAVFVPAASRGSAAGVAVLLGGVLSVFLLQNPAMLVLLVLLLWFVLCVVLGLLLLFAPLVQKLPFRKRGTQFPGARAAVESGGATQAPASTAPVTGALSPAPHFAQDHSPQPARFCPRCGVRNIFGASRCAVCGGELPQMSGRATEQGHAHSQAAASAVCSSGLPDVPAGFSLEQQAASRVPLMALPGSAGAVYQRSARHQPGLALRFGAKSDRGQKRAASENEDGFLAVTGARRSRDHLEPFGLFVVADGMGGHGDGHRASGTAVERLFHSLVPSLLYDEWPEHELLPLLSRAIQEVNEQLYQANQRDQTRMGCTVTAALVTGREAHICNVGDSRTYLLGTLAPLRRVTVDHSLVESLVVAGIIQRAEVYTHPKRNQIFRCLGHQPWVEVDTFRQSLTSGEMLLLCSDGLWEMVRDPEMEAILRQTHDLAEVSGHLVARANANGGLDNITVIVAAFSNETISLTQPGLLSLSSTQPGLLVSLA